MPTSFFAMVIAGTQSRVRLARLAVIGLVCVAGAAGAAYMLRPVDAPAVVTASTNASPGNEPAPGFQAAVAAPESRIAPSFDVVRVGPAGNSVLAGRAEPGAMVAVTDGDRTLGQARANERGEWVLTPDAPLAPGGRELGLSARTPGGLDMKGQGTMLLAVPGPAISNQAVALLVPQSGAPRVLQGSPGAAVMPGNSRLGLDSVDYDDQGALRFAGSAPPGAQVRVYVDNAAAGDAMADGSGRWALTPRSIVAAGVHRLRVDQLTAAGKVLARVELPFQRTAVPALELASGRVVVQPGQNLWRLARRVYGTGVRYTVIYLANRDQIRDPRLIYPGQAFALPHAVP